MIDTHTCTRRDGFALALVLMVMLVVVALATAAATISMNTLVVTGHQSRSSAAARVADDGLELARALLNAEPETYPDSGFAVLEEDALVTDALGDTIPGVLRSTYAGPVGVVSGEYGVVGAVVSVARDGGGGAAIRRMNVPQESFARFAYFTDQEPSTIGFGGGDLL
ncbi:MAG TPA: hypothetical protein VK966_12240, partial [Longimicrobiales bacterium]|nr:hypothetical protein [Longimicrobiales bacterium]